MTPREQPTFAALSDIGRVRTHNEDSVLAEPPMYVVADGLGGHEAGEVASSIAIETLRDHAPRHADAAALARAVRAANKAVLRAAREGIGKAGMGTTLTAVLAEGTHLAIAHVGDSRAYLLHNGHLERLTDDHSMVADMVRRGQLTEEESRVHPNRSIITRALGTDHDMVADAFEVDVAAGDHVMLCSDGLTGMLDDARIEEMLRSYRNPMTAAQMLIAAANEAGGYDNVSVVIFEIAGGGQEAGRSLGRRIRGVLAWIVAFLLVVAGIAYGAYRYAESRAFLIIENDAVVIYRGVPGELAGVSLKWRAEETTIGAEGIAQLPLGTRKKLVSGIAADDLASARAIAAGYAEIAAQAAPDTVPVGGE